MAAWCIWCLACIMLGIVCDSTPGVVDSVTTEYANCVLMRQAWVTRLSDEAEAMIERRFVPSLKRSGQRYQVNPTRANARMLSCYPSQLLFLHTFP